VRRNWPRYLLTLLVVGLLVAGPLAYSRHRASLYRNFRVVEDGRLYRSGQMSLPGLQRTIEEYGIRTVVSLRYAEKEGDRPPDWQEEEFCKAHGVRYVRVRPQAWSACADGAVPAQKPVDEFLKVMDDPSVYPVLIHCFAGMHRTGSYCAIYRMEYQGWNNFEALQELKSLGYKHLDDEKDVQGYLENYVPRHKRKPAE
jgi:tyrosine-protein phosphatase SIW14